MCEFVLFFYVDLKGSLLEICVLSVELLLGGWEWLFLKWRFEIFD